MRPIRVAIVGSGIAALVVAKRLLDQLDQGVRIDIIEMLVAPSGLVLTGVAPDHMSIRGINDSLTATVLGDPRVSYYGNTFFGLRLILDDLRSGHDVVVFAVGAQGDKKLHIPGERLGNVMGSLPYVGWYNGHQLYWGLPVEADKPSIGVAGVGNVGADLVRIHCLSLETLRRATDISPAALDQFGRRLQRIKAGERLHVWAFGRRDLGLIEMKPKEVVEICRLREVDLDLRDEDLTFSEASREYLARLEESGNAELRQRVHERRRIQHILRERMRTRPAGHPFSIHLRFSTSAVRLLGSNGHPTDSGSIASTVVGRNEMVYEDGEVVAVPTGEELEPIPMGLFLRAISFERLQRSAIGLAYDPARKTYFNTSGRVCTATGEVVPGVYLVGWALTGPKGLISQTTIAATAMADQIVDDLPQLPRVRDVDASPDVFPGLLAARGFQPVSYQEWDRLVNAEERRRGQVTGRPRVTLSPEELADTLRRPVMGSRRMQIEAVA